MSPLHLSYRPTKLSEIVGNKSTVAAIEGMLNRKSDWPHAWLFTGVSGTGKTTAARIVANRLGVADVDLRELNIASLRGIDNAREIQEQMRLRPLGGKHRAWILDEAHMGTKEFWNAMLKPLEDTPSHVFFFICTTEPQKLLKTVVTRCEAANFKMETLSEKQLMGLLCDVLKSENVDVPTKVLTQICQDATGSARAALGILDKIIDMDQDEMLEAAKRTAAEQVETIELCRLLIKGENVWSRIIKVLNALEAEPEQIRQAILGYMNAVLMKEDNPRAWLIMDTFKEPMHYNGRAGLTMACYELIMDDPNKSPF